MKSSGVQNAYDGSIRVKLTTTEALQQLECHPVTVLADKHFFRKLDTLETKYFLDLSGVVDEKERNNLRSPHKLVLQVVYDTFR